MAGLGGNLKAARERKRLTQKALAGLVGSTGNTLAQWERDELLPSDPLQLIRLAKVLDTSVEELFGEKPRNADDLSYRAGLLDAARRLKELVAELEGGRVVVGARSVKTGQHSRKNVGLDGIKKVRKQVDRTLKIAKGAQDDGLTEK